MSGQREELRTCPTCGADVLALVVDELVPGTDPNIVHPTQTVVDWLHECPKLVTSMSGVAAGRS